MKKIHTINEFRGYCSSLFEILGTNGAHDSSCLRWVKVKLYVLGIDGMFGHMTLSSVINPWHLIAFP